ncbi:MAG: MSMEG_0567/Sll0786 family nitrogen starvation N-acetyltransferase [Cyanobacteriota bacterium]|nr:MSMEG_0567/Sll0786 family nitrogen starvation N-acetyltransferase [Cyanobacteriota bacterium]
MVFLDPSSVDIGSSHSSAPAAFTPSVRWGIGIDAEDFRLSPTASSDRFSFHLLHPRAALLRGYWLLRSAIFCEEQHLFEVSDRDALDAMAYPISALHHGRSHGGQVVGVVRIVETEHRLWYGGRLGVHPAFRRHNQIGKGLIWKAVTTAHGWGCERFLATVQIQNVRFFQRLHWDSLEELEIRGIRHHLMQADLAYYQPSREPRPAPQLLTPNGSRLAA